MPRVVFVCTQNQFRSPLAAAMLRDELIKRGYGSNWLVDSVGSWVKKLAPATPEAVQEAEIRGLDLSQHTAHGIEAIHRDEVDLFLVMEKGQKESILIDYPKLRKKMFLLSELSGVEYSIPDPYITDDSHSEVAAEIEELIQRNFDRIIQLATYP